MNVVVTLAPSTRYSVGAKAEAEVTIDAAADQAGTRDAGGGSQEEGLFTDDALDVRIARWCLCGGPNPFGMVANLSTAGQIRGPVSCDPIRYGEGDVFVGATDLASGGFGLAWGQTRTWSNRDGFAGFSRLGNGWATQESIHVVEDGDGNVFVNLTANDALAFELDTATLVNYLGGTETLTHDTTNKLYVLNDGTGTKFEFFDYHASYPTL